MDKKMEKKMEKMDFFAKSYDIEVELMRNIELIKLVTADINRLLNMPLSQSVKTTAIVELFHILKDNL